MSFVFSGHKDLWLGLRKDIETMNDEEIYKLKSKLPAIPGINGREDYLNSAVLVLLMKINDDYHFVFQKRNKNIRQGGEICFPGGKHDKSLDRNMEDTALRETTEEIGVLPEDISIIGALDMIIAPMGAIVEPFLGVTDKVTLKELHLNRDEVEKVFTIPFTFFKNNKPEMYKAQIKVHPSYIDKNGEEVILFPSEDLGLGSNYTKPWGNSENTIYVYKTKEGVIWGLTARIIYDVVRRLDL
ncbi:MAG: pyrophosphohydrolase [Clostridia bacterium]|jgi:8-oxo-dGTP pyrophosphatase MutT (NUDIX family)|nr:pyrophosphohydrolase [Clostridia bacterium]